MIPRRAAAVIAAGLAACAGCAPGPEPIDPEPRRVVLVYIDSLRADHLGTYGYERETSPRIDALAARSATFDQALTAAPWTLPAARGLLSGRQPEEYEASITLAERLAAEGFATAMFSASRLLSAEHEMQRGFDVFQVSREATGEGQIDQALAWLSLIHGQDLLLVIHLPDLRLPYTEAEPYRSMYAGQAVPPLGEGALEAAALGPALRDPRARSHVVGRYDNNVRRIDDQVGRLVDALDEDDTVILLADHGEELWDHGSFGHGHALYHELIRVPLVYRAPGIVPGRIGVTASLLDVVPTLLDQLDIPFGDDLDGRSLWPLMCGEATADDALTERAVAFGRTLLGPPAWGYQRARVKYATRLGAEKVVDLERDPVESISLVSGRGWTETRRHRDLLAEALDREVRVGLQLAAWSEGEPFTNAVVARLRVPGGARTAFVADQPAAEALTWTWTEGQDVIARWEGGFRRGREVLVIPRREIHEIGSGIELSVEVGGRRLEVPVDLGEGQRRGSSRRRVAATGVGPLVVALHYSVIPTPAPDVRRLPTLSRREVEPMRRTDPDMLR